MTDTKSILLSKGVWGGIIAVAAGAAGLFGFTIGTDDQAGIVNNIDSIIAAVGGLLAIYGRIKATKLLG